MVGGADDTLFFHLLDDAGRAIVADLQVPLDKAGRGFLLSRNEGHRLVVELVAAALAAGGLEAGKPVRRSLVIGHIVDIVGLALVFEEIDQRFAAVPVSVIDPRRWGVEQP